MQRKETYRYQVTGYGSADTRETASVVAASASAAAQYAEEVLAFHVVHAVRLKEVVQIAA